jgi:hypothetical protein
MRLVVVLLLFVSAPTTLLAADPVTVTFPKPEKGQRWEVEFKRTHDIKIEKTLDGKADTIADTMTSTWDYTETVDEFDKVGTLTKFRRTYGNAEAVVAKQTKPMSFRDTEVVFEKGEKLWTAKTKAGQAIRGIESRLIVADLGELPTVPLALFTPSKPVTVNTAWQPDKKAALAAFAFHDYMTFDADKAVLSAKLTKVYEKDGKRCGVVAFTLDAPILTVKGKDVLVGELGSKLTVEATVDGVIDGSERRFTRTSKTKMAFATSLEFNGKPFQLANAAEITQTEVVRPAK